MQIPGSIVTTMPGTSDVERAPTSCTSSPIQCASPWTKNRSHVTGRHRSPESARKCSRAIRSRFALVAPGRTARIAAACAPGTRSYSARCRGVNRPDPGNVRVTSAV